MVWVRSEYAGELAVLSAWLSTLIPWNITFSSGIEGGSFLFVRFPFFQVRYNYGVPVARAVTVRDPLSAIAFQRGQSLELAYLVWAIGAAVLVVAVAYAVGYYFREETVESWPLDPVRGIGVLLILAGVTLAVATYLLTVRGFPGVPIPLGVVFLWVFGGLLLRVERA